MPSQSLLYERLGSLAGGRDFLGLRLQRQAGVGPCEGLKENSGERETGVRGSSGREGGGCGRAELMSDRLS